MKRPSKVGTLLVVALLAACGKSSSDPLRSVPDVAAPPEVLAVVSVDSVANTLTGLGAWADAMQPGAAAGLGPTVVGMLLGRALGVRRLGGVDLAGPLHLLFVDSESAHGLVAVLRVTDAEALDHANEATATRVQDGWAVIGPRAAVEIAAPWAFANLCTRPAPSSLTFVNYTAAGFARHRGELEAVRARIGSVAPYAGSGLGKIIDGYFAATLAMLGDTDRVVGTLTFHDDIATVDVAIVPLPGTQLAAFQAAQVPSDYALLAQLPDVVGPMVMAGTMRSGPYHDAILDIVGELMNLHAPGDETIAAMRAFVAAVDGTFAGSASMSLGQFRFDELAGVSDEAAAAAALSKAIGTLSAGHDVDFGGMKAKMVGELKRGEHDGVAISGYNMTYDLATVPEAQRDAMDKMYPGGVVRELVAVFDKRFAIHMGGDIEGIARLIDAGRGKGPTFAPTDGMKSAIAESRERAESMLFMMDIPAFAAAMGAMPAPATASAPFVVGFGVSGGALHLRLAMSNTTAAGMKNFSHR